MNIETLTNFGKIQWAAPCIFKDLIYFNEIQTFTNFGKMSLAAPCRFKDFINFDEHLDFDPLW